MSLRSLRDELPPVIKAVADKKQEPVETKRRKFPKPPMNITKKGR